MHHLNLLYTVANDAGLHYLVAVRFSWWPGSTSTALLGSTAKINSLHAQSLAKLIQNILNLFAGCPPTIQSSQTVDRNPPDLGIVAKHLRWPGSQCDIVGAPKSGLYILGKYLRLLMG